jgi:hypothetical protein
MSCYCGVPHNFRIHRLSAWEYFLRILVLQTSFCLRSTIFLSYAKFMNILEALTASAFVSESKPNKHWACCLLALFLNPENWVSIHSVTVKFPNWCYYSNTTNTVNRGWTGLVRKNVYLYAVQVSTCLVDAYEDYICFGEVSCSVISVVSKWNKDQWLSFV